MNVTSSEISLLNIVIGFVYFIGISSSGNVRNQSVRQRSNIRQLISLHQPLCPVEVNNHTDDVECTKCNLLQLSKPRPKYPLTFIKPNKIGHVEEIQLVEGKTHRRKTLALDPPVYEIPNFLTSEETDIIKGIAENKQLSQSTLFGDGQGTRKSESAWISIRKLNKSITRLSERYEKLTEQSSWYINHAEKMQIVKYETGGYYYTHHDSGPYHLPVHNLPCCNQVKYCTTNLEQCCQLCRLMTVMVYLNDVEEGGETAFPIADTNTETLHEYLSDVNNRNLTTNCYKSSLLVSPKTGTAVMWYNHEVDEMTGLMGNLILRSYHGGCNVLKGVKWIINLWIWFHA
ncbi:hypothetical protein SNE40_007446 [Patella caerulea]|uniref:Fe2OG dioxygenase domain-containing protein n=1 Tax=Patella caerulea TaxID=87958 RepID=A0AAN8JXQ9_PATCE